MNRGFPTRILEAEIIGVAEAIANLTELGAVDPVVKATLTLSESGFVSISNAVAFGEIKDDSISGGDFKKQNSLHYSFILILGKIKGLFVGSPSAEETSTESIQDTPLREARFASATGPTSSDVPESTPTGQTDKEDKKKKVPVDDTIALTVNTKFTTIAPMTVSEKQESRKQ